MGKFRKGRLKEKAVPYKNPEAKLAYDRQYREKNREKRNARQRALYAENPEVARAHSKKWYENNKEAFSVRRKGRPSYYTKAKAYQIKYGLALIDYYIMLEEQGYQCPVCHDWLYPQKESTHVDHCHTTGKVRGILHSACNQLLGLAHDSTEILGFAIDYLNKHKTREVS